MRGGRSRRQGSVRWFATGPGPNLLTPNAAGAETNLTGMEVHANTTLARDTAVFRSGVASYRMTATGATPAIRTPIAAKIPIIGGANYVSTCWGRSGTILRAGWVGIWWYNAANGFLGAVNGEVVSSPLGAWTQWTVTGAAPEGTTQGHLVISWANCVTGDVNYIDDVHLGTA